MHHNVSMLQKQLLRLGRYANLSPLWLTVVIWALVAYVVVKMVLALWLGHDSSPAVAPVFDASRLQFDSAQLAHALGAAPGASTASAPQTPLQERFKLMGVVAGSSGQGVALISQDGQEAKPVLVGQAVGEGLVLQSTYARRVMLAPNLNAEPTVVLELPPLQ